MKCTLLLLLVCSLAVGGVPQHIDDEEKTDPKPAEVQPKHPVASGAKEKVGLCTDLHRFSCAPGAYNDGTGVAQSDTVVDKKLQEFRDSEIVVFEKRFAEAIKVKPRLRNQALSVLGLADYCNEATAPEVLAKCEADLVKGLADMTMQRALPNDRAKKAGGFGSGLEDYDLLTGSPDFKEIEAELVSAARKKLIDEKGKEKVEKEVFPRVQAMIAELLKGSIANEKLRTNLVDKVMAIRFAGVECSDLSPGGVERLDSIFIPNASYNGIDNTFRYCNGYNLHNSSVFAIVQTIAHEIAHAFDPCMITLDVKGLAFEYTDKKNLQQSEQEYPFEGLLGCLRSKESIRAKRLHGGEVRLFSPLSNHPHPHDVGFGAVLPDKGETGGQAGGVKLEQEETEAYGQKEKRSPFCDDDQIGEAFADRIGIEILPKYIATHYPTLTADQMRLGYSNVFRGSCTNTLRPGDMGFDVHPPTKDRINRMILPSPDVRKQMGCSTSELAGVTHCPIKGIL